MGRHIGLVAPKHGGKTTAGNYLAKYEGFTKIALADPLKNTAVAMINTFHLIEGLPAIDRAFLDQHKDEVFVPFLQWLGTEYGRQFLHSPYRWINKFLSAAVASEKPVVCDDIRFINEAETLRNNGFLIVRLRRPEDDRQESLASSGFGVDSSVHAHASETELEQIDADVLVEAPDLDALYRCLRWVVAFQKLSSELLVMSAHVPHDAKPGYNEDFNREARVLVAVYEQYPITLGCDLNDILEKMRGHAWA